jgi:hypothetical protein
MPQETGKPGFIRGAIEVVFRFRQRSGRVEPVRAATQSKEIS